MKKFSIRVAETSSTVYVIEANSAEQAENLFQYWLNANQDIVDRDLERGYQGWSQDAPQETTPSAEVDSDYSDLMDAVWEELDFKITYAMTSLEMTPSENAIRKIGEMVLEDAGFENTGHFNDDDVRMAIRSYIDKLMNK